MKITILFFVIIISSIECINLKFNEFCYPKQEKELKCHGKFNYICGDFVCTKTQYSCHLLSFFSGSKGKNYELFMSKIKDCLEPPKYKWNSNDMCLNEKYCIKPTIHRLWSTQIKVVDCKCIGKHNLKCDNTDYCASDKRACDDLNKKMIISIKKCGKN